jgi:ribosomal 30S subunit maturation factor RimM
MHVSVTIELSQGIVGEVRVFSSGEPARKLEKQWLEQHEIKNAIGRECKAQNGTEFLIYECELEA